MFSCDAKTYFFLFSEPTPVVDDVIINATDVTVDVEVPVNENFTFDEVKFALVEGNGVVRRVS